MASGILGRPSEPAPRFNPLLRWLNLGLLALIVGLLLFVSARSYFHADDFSHLLSARNDTLRDLTGIISRAEYSGHYRPLVKVLFVVNYIASGLNPTSYFVTSTLVFLLNILGFFVLARQLSPDRLYAQCALLLLLLQLNTYLYTVTWIGAAANMLVSLFILVALTFYIMSWRSQRWRYPAYALAVIAFALALLSKEVACVLIVVFPLYDLVFLWLPGPRQMRRLRPMALRFLGFAATLLLYTQLRRAAGAFEFTGAGTYTLALGSNLLINSAFFVLQLGTMVGVVLLWAVPAIWSDRRRLDGGDYRLVAFGLAFAVVSLAPDLLLEWTSPTWLFLPALGTTLASAALLSRALGTSSPRKARLAVYGVIACALVMCSVVFLRLEQARWLQWGDYTRNILSDVQARYPAFPSNSTVWFVDANAGADYGVSRLLRNHAGSAVRLWYGDPSLDAYVVSNDEELAQRRQDPAQARRSAFVFVIRDGRVTDAMAAYR